MRASPYGAVSPRGTGTEISALPPGRAEYLPRAGYPPRSEFVLLNGPTAGPLAGLGLTQAADRAGELPGRATDFADNRPLARVPRTLAGKNVRFGQYGRGQLRVEVAAEPGGAAAAGQSPDARSPRPARPGQREPGVDLGVMGLGAGHGGGRGDPARRGIDALADAQPEHRWQRGRRGVGPPVQQQRGETAEADQGDGGQPAEQEGGPGPPAPRRAARAGVAGAGPGGGSMGFGGPRGGRLRRAGSGHRVGAGQRFGRRSGPGLFPEGHP